MKTVFADAFYYIALISPDDDAHAAAREWTGSFDGNMVTTTWVLTEVADGVSRSTDRQATADFLHAVLSDPNVTTIEPSLELFLAGLLLYGKRLDKEWSLTDCISFVVMQREQLFEALTADHHFQQAGFAVLFSDN